MNNCRINFKIVDGLFVCRIVNELPIGTLIAFRLFRNGDLIERSKYDNNKEFVFNQIPKKGGWFVNVYLRINNNVTRIKSETIFFDKNSGNKLINCNYFEIKKPVNIDESIERYFENGFLPAGRSDLKPWKFDFPIDWLSNPFEDRNWMFHVQSWRMLDPFLARFEDEDINYISKIINSWIDYEERADLIKKKWLWYDMATGLRALKISYFILNCYHKGIDHKVYKIESLIKSHFKHLTNISELNKGNHGLFQVNGLMSLIWVIENEVISVKGIEIKRSFEFAKNNLGRLVLDQLGEFGVHTEHSPEYHFFATNIISKIIKSPWWKNVNLPDISALLEKSNICKSWIVDPLGQCAPVGDSSKIIAFPKDEKIIYKWPHKSYSNQILAVLDGYVVVRSKPEVCKDSSNFLFFQGSFNSGAHKQADDLSFILQENGKFVFTDPGKYSYNKDKFRSYFTSSLAHNTVTIDEESYSTNSKDAYGSAIEFADFSEDGYSVISAYVSHKKNCFDHRRVVIYKPKSFLYILDFLMDTKHQGSRKVQFSWNLDSRFSLFKSDKHILIKDEKADDTLNFEVSSLNGFCSLNTYRGFEDGEKLYGWNSPSYLQVNPSPMILCDGTLDGSNIFLTKIKLQEKSVDDLNINININSGKVETGSEYVNNILMKSVLNFSRKMIASHYDDLPYFRYKGVSFFFKRNTSSKKLFVSFHGAVRPDGDADNRSALPCFRLYNLNIKNQPNLLCFSDALLDKYKKDGVYLGWFLDTKKIAQRDVIYEIVCAYMKEYGFDEVVFHGSSGGGHIAVDMALRTHQVAIVSNCQFDLPKYPKFEVLQRVLEKNSDSLISYDFEKNINNPSNAKIIAYCNLDDYTLEHHKYLHDLMIKKKICHFESIYFSGNAIAEERGVRNHNIGFPNGVHIKNILNDYFCKINL